MHKGSVDLDQRSLRVETISSHQANFYPSSSRTPLPLGRLLAAALPPNPPVLRLHNPPATPKPIRDVKPVPFAQAPLSCLMEDSLPFKQLSNDNNNLYLPQSQSHRGKLHKP